MSQTRTFDYEADDATLLLNNRIRGIEPYGVYKGYKFVPGSLGGMNLAFLHDHDETFAALTGIDGVATAPNRLTSVAGGFLLGVTVGMVVTIADPVNSGNNGDYFVTVVVNDNNIDLNRNWAVPALTLLNFRITQAIGRILTTDCVVVEEDECQDNEILLVVGGVSWRMDLIYCRYVYNASLPPNAASYFASSCTHWAGVADGLCSGRTLTSVIGGFVANVAQGDILRIQDLIDFGDNGEYTVTEIVSDNELRVDEFFPVGGTNRAFSTYRYPGLTPNDIWIGTCEVPAGAVAVTACTFRYFDRTSQLIQDVQKYEPGQFQAGILSGLHMYQDFGAPGTINLPPGTAITPAGTLLRSEVEIGSAAVPALAAAGQHRIDSLVMIRPWDSKLEVAQLETVLVGGIPAIVANDPVAPTMSQILTALNALDDRYYKSQDVVVLGEIYVDDSVIETRPYLAVSSDRRVRVRAKRGDLLGTEMPGDFFGATALEDAMEWVTWYLRRRGAVLGAATIVEANPEIDVFVEGHQPIYEDFWIPSMTTLRGPGRVVSETGDTLIFSGRAIVGNHIAQTWVAAIAGAPPGLPLGYNLYTIAITAPYQIGTDPANCRFVAGDKVELYAAVAGTLFTGWVYVVNAWSFSVVLLNTYNIADDTGSIRVIKQRNGAENLALVGAGVEVEHVERAKIQLSSDTGIVFKQNSLSEFDLRVDGWTWSALTAIDLSDFGPGLANHYKLLAGSVGGLAQFPGRGEMYSRFDRILAISPPGSGVSTLTFTGTQDATIDELLGVNQSANPIDIVVDGINFAFGRVLSLLDTTFTINGGSQISIGRLDVTLIDIAVGSTSVVVQAYQAFGGVVLDSTLDDSTIFLGIRDRSKENQDRNLRYGSEALISWDLATQTLSWDVDLLIDLPFTTGYNRILSTASPMTPMINGDRVVVSLVRTAAGIIDVVPTIVSKATPLVEGHDVLILAVRIGDRIYLCDGASIQDGQAVSFGTTPPPLGSVVYESLATSAKEAWTTGLGDWIGEGSTISENPQVIFVNLALVGYVYTAASGRVQFAGPVDFSGVEVDDVFIDGAGKRHRIRTVNDGGDWLDVARNSDLTVGFATKWQGAIVRGELHWVNSLVTVFTAARTTLGGIAGVTQAGAVVTDFSDAAGLAVLVGSILFLNDAVAPGSNGVYRVVAIVNATTVTLDRAFPAALAGLTYEFRWCAVTFAGAVDIPMVDESAYTHYLFWDTAGEPHRILGKDTGDVLVFDYEEQIEDEPPATSNDGMITTDNNPRGLNLGDLRTIGQDDRVYVNPPSRVWDPSQMNRDGVSGVYGGEPLYQDPRDQRLLYGGYIKSEAGYIKFQDDAAGRGSFVEFTFWGRGAIPLVRGDSNGMADLVVWIDGRRVQTDYSVASTSGIFDGKLDRYVQEAPIENAETLLLGAFCPLSLGVHTIRIVVASSAGTGLFYLAGFRILGDTYYGSSYGFMAPGTGYIDGKKVTLAATDKALALGGVASWKGGSNVFAIGKDSLIKSHLYPVAEKTQISGTAAAASPTVTATSLDPAQEGYRYGDMLVIEEVATGNQVYRYIEAMTPTSVTTDANIGYNGAVTVDYYGATYLTRLPMNEIRVRKRTFNLMSMASGQENASPFEDVLDLDINTVGDCSYVSSDDSTILVCNDVEGTYDTTLGKFMVNLFDVAGAFIRIGFYGTGMDIHVPYASQYDATTIEPFNVWIDGYTVGTYTLAQIRGGALRVCRDLPMGYHTIQLESSAAPYVGSNLVFVLEGFTVYTQDYSEVVDELALAVMDRHGENLIHLANDPKDPGRGWTRFHYKSMFVSGVNAVASFNPAYRAGVAIQLTDVASIFFQVPGDVTQLVIRGTLGTATIYRNGAATAWTFNTIIVPPSFYDWTTIEIRQTGPGVATIVECYDVRINKGSTYRALLDERIPRNDFVGQGAYQRLPSYLPAPERENNSSAWSGNLVEVANFDSTVDAAMFDCWITVVNEEPAAYLVNFHFIVEEDAATGNTFTYGLVVDGEIQDTTGLYGSLNFGTANEKKPVAGSGVVELAPGEHSIGVYMTSTGSTFDIFSRSISAVAVARLTR